jgi:3-hydroxybutyryl-CoA dehydrogenase
MNIIVAARDDQWEELIKTAPEEQWKRVDDCQAFSQEADADLFFNLKEDAAAQDYTTLAKPVIIHSVIDTLMVSHLPDHVLRINAWPTFLNRSSWEIAGKADSHIQDLVSQLGKQLIFVADEPGFIAARVIAMIINEGYFALGDEVSSKAEIDIAMKLGTNYPYGPFEWAAKVGVKNIYRLLSKLNLTDSRYAVAPLLIQEAQ